MKKKNILLLVAVSLLTAFAAERELLASDDDSLKQCADVVMGSTARGRLLSPADSGYIAASCWQLFRLTGDSTYRREGERITGLMPYHGNRLTMTSLQAEALYLAYRSVFEATGGHEYRHSVIDVCDFIQTDTALQHGGCLDALLWAAQHGGCPCFKETAEQSLKEHPDESNALEKAQTEIKKVITGGRKPSGLSPREMFFYISTFDKKH